MSRVFCFVLVISTSFWNRVAFSQNSVWFTSGALGAQDSILELEVDTSSGDASVSFDVEMWMHNDTANVGDPTALLGWALDLEGGTPKFSIQNPVVNNTDFVFLSSNGVAGPGPDLWVGGFAFSLFSFDSVVGTLRLATFTLNVELPQGSLEATDISARIGGNEWGQADVLDPIANVSVAGNPEVEGFGGNDAGVAIRIVGVPEPITASLLVAVVPFLFRRRRNAI